MKKQILSLKQKVGIVVISVILIEFLLLKLTLFRNFDFPYGNLLLLLGIVVVYYIIVCIASRILNKSIYRQYKKDFKYVQQIHKIRYKAYFQGDTQAIEEDTKRLETWGEVVLKNGDILLKMDGMKGKHKAVREMMDKTREMLEREFVEY